MDFIMTFVKIKNGGHFIMGDYFNNDYQNNNNYGNNYNGYNPYEREPKAPREKKDNTLGKKFVKEHGIQPGVLVKLIDSAERLTLQVHPDRPTAERLFHSPYGKTECWHILEAREVNGEEPCIYYGFKEGMTKEKWQDLFDRQDIAVVIVGIVICYTTARCC